MRWCLTPLQQEHPSPRRRLPPPVCLHLPLRNEVKAARREATTTSSSTTSTTSLSACVPVSCLPFATCRPQPLSCRAIRAHAPSLASPFGSAWPVPPPHLSPALGRDIARGPSRPAAWTGLQCSAPHQRAQTPHLTFDRPRSTTPQDLCSFR